MYKTSPKQNYLKTLMTGLKILVNLLASLAGAFILAVSINVFLGTSFATLGLPIAIVLAASSLIVGIINFYLMINEPPPRPTTTPPPESFSWAYTLYMTFATLNAISAGAAAYMGTYMGLVAITTMLTWPIAPAVYATLGTVLGVICAINGMYFALEVATKFWDVLNPPLDTAGHDSTLKPQKRSAEQPATMPLARQHADRPITNISDVVNIEAYLSPILGSARRTAPYYNAPQTEDTNSYTPLPSSPSY